MKRLFLMKYFPGRICCRRADAEGICNMKMRRRFLIILVSVFLWNSVVVSGETGETDVIGPMPSRQEVTVPSATPVPEITPTSAPLSSVTETEQGTLSVPDHPDAVSHDKLIFIGDSRTEGIRDAVQDGSIWSCKSAMGYTWMADTGVPQIEDEIENNTAVIILMGVNDPSNVNNYINYINEKAAQWAALGAKTYFVSVGPVQSDPYVTNAEIESFNTAMQTYLIDVTYIDIYTWMTEGGFSTIDGTHYPSDLSIQIYNYILEHLEESRTGIWG